MKQDYKRAFEHFMHNRYDGETIEHFNKRVAHNKIHGAGAYELGKGRSFERMSFGEFQETRRFNEMLENDLKERKLTIDEKRSRDLADKDAFIEARAKERGEQLTPRKPRTLKSKEKANNSKLPAYIIR